MTTYISDFADVHMNVVRKRPLCHSKSVRIETKTAVWSASNGTEVFKVSQKWHMSKTIASQTLKLKCVLRGTRKRSCSSLAKIKVFTDSLVPLYSKHIEVLDQTHIRNERLW